MTSDCTHNCFENEFEFEQSFRFEIVTSKLMSNRKRQISTQLETGFICNDNIKPRRVYFNFVIFSIIP